MLSIKNATVADIPLIRHLTMEVWPQTYTPIIGAEQVAYMIGLFYAPEALQKQMEINHHSFILCYDNETPVGFASYSDTGEGNFKLHKLYVLPVCQGKGAGKFMIDHIVLDIKNKGGVALILNVNRFNAAAIAFYKKVGFRLVVNEDIDIGDGYFMNDHIFGLAV